MSNNSGQAIDEYKSYTAKKHITLIILFLLMIVTSLVSIMAGSSGISLSDVFKTFVGKGTLQTNAIVFDVRLPRVATAAVVGFALALAGCVMQGVLRNPLASASTLGVSQGAAFGATVAIVLLGAGGQHNSRSLGAVNIMNPYLVTICAFIGGIICVLVILALSRVKMITPASMVLAGVALSALFTGGTTLIQYFADESVLSAVVYWTFGDLGRTTFPEISLILIIFILTFIYFMFRSWSFNAMQNGSDTAKSLGVDVDKLTLVSMVLGALLAAVAVSFVGIISFVGLVAPHMVRKFVGNDYRFLLPASSLAGACILLLSDLFGRMIIAPVILPIGAITSFLGAPLFLYLIYKGSK